ncbi:MAG: primosomal protein N' [Cyclobacteriaceae bacterium]
MNQESYGISKFAEVIVPIPVPKLFTYSIPSHLKDQIKIGSRVVVPFGNKKVLTGVVSSFHNDTPTAYQPRLIAECLDDIPHVNEKQLKVFDWISDYYMANPGDVLNVALPSGLKLSSESFLQLHPYFDVNFSGEDFTDEESRLISTLQKSSAIILTEAAKILTDKNWLKSVHKLIKKEVLLIFEQVKEKFTAKKEKRIRLNESFITDRAALQSLMEELDSKQTQLDVLMAYLREVPVLSKPEKNQEGIDKRLLMKAGISPSSLRTLTNKGVFESFDKVVPRLDFSENFESPDINLTPAQQVAFDDILNLFEQKQTVLLHGLTGSGKTEVYMSLIRHVLESGQQVLFLLPEIAITTQMVTRLRKIFGNAVGVYHSRYSDNERVEVWKSLVYGKVSFVVGVRSAVFLPFSDLGLIVIDEEHETSYKQFDSAPRYNARDVAQMLAREHHAKVLLGSATPSLESFFLAKRNKYGLVNLNERYGAASLPEIEIGNIVAERKAKTLHGDFTSLLVNRLDESLQKKEQSIVFQNRRGYAHYLQCQDCGWIPDCHSCAVSLTYHMQRNHIRCHYCGHQEKVPYACPACGSTRLKMTGFGTEKIEDDLKLLLPTARIQRMDLDTTRSKYSYQKIIDDFTEGDIDILVGTQMVSKGLHFDKVNTVGAFDADRMLHFPDFRASERTFQLLTQVSGRAGRSGQSSKVVIQTSKPSHPVIQFVINHDYHGFYEQELQDRFQYGYPPYTRIIKIYTRHKDEVKCQKAAEALYLQLKGIWKDFFISEPHEPMVARIRNLYYREILLKIPRNYPNLAQVKARIISLAGQLYQQSSFRQIQVIYDVDPF